MRDGAPDEVLSGTAGYWCRVSSWLGGELLAADVPVSSGRVTATVKSQVPERVTFTVPRWDGRDWLPGDDPTHPLARFGQVLQVAIIVWSAVRNVEYETQVGRFLIQDWDYDDQSGYIRVTAVGVLQQAADDRLVSPVAPRPTGTLASEFRRLLPAGMSVGIHPDLVNRRCPQSMQWAEDRLKALYEIADAWPARLRTDQWGQLQLSPPLPDIPTPAVTLRDGERGTVVRAGRYDTRDGAYNRVVVRASITDNPSAPPIAAVAEQTTGPMRVDGPYLPVTKFWSSPLIETYGQAFRSADTMLASSLLPSRTIPVEIVPDPRLDLDDPVEILRDGMRDWGWIVGYDLPLTVNDGAMRIDVGVRT